MSTVTIEIDDQTRVALVAAAAKAGAPPKKLAANLLRDALSGLDDTGRLSLQAKRALAGALVDKSPWNNPIDSEWDSYKR